MSIALIRRSVPPVGCFTTASTSAAVMSVAITGGFAVCASTAAESPAIAAIPVIQPKRFVVMCVLMAAWRRPPAKNKGSLALHPLLETAARRARIAVAGQPGEHVAFVVRTHALGAR